MREKDEERKRVKRAPPQSRGGYTVAAISLQRGWNSQRTTTKILVFRPNSRSLSSWAAILIFAVERGKSRPNLHSLSRSILGFFGTGGRRREKDSRLGNPPPPSYLSLRSGKKKRWLGLSGGAGPGFGWLGIAGPCGKGNWSVRCQL